MSVPVSLCVFRIELNDVFAVETEKQTGEFLSYEVLVRGIERRLC